VSSSDSLTGGLGVGDSELSHIEERKHESVAAVRLVNKDGDVIWSTTQESQGAKFHRASTDVADRIAKKLVEDYERAKKLKPLAENPVVH
jgi:altronate dehydratase